MAFPSYVLTRTVSVGGAAILESSDPLRIRLTITASKSLINADTGYRFKNSRFVTTSEAGTDAVAVLPRTDMSGWKDARTGDIIDVTAEGSYTHQYIALVEYLTAEGDSAGISPDTIGPFILPAGDGAIDLDKLIPVGSSSGESISFPAYWDELVQQAQQAATAAQAALLDSAQFVADEISTPGTPAELALNTKFVSVDGDGELTVGGVVIPIEGGVDPTTATVGDATFKRYKGTPSTMTVVLTGHSLLYGQDTSTTGTDPGGNGSTNTRNPRRPAVSLAAALAYVIPGTTVVDQGYPGDRADQGLTRWAGGVSGDVEFLFYETNEWAQNIPIATYKDNITALVERSIKRGSQPILLGGGPTRHTGAPTRLIRAYTAATRAVAARMGVPFYDVAELLRSLPTATEWSAGDNVHYSTEAYNLLGYKLASVLGPYGPAMPKVGPGSVIYPAHGAAYGGTLVTRTTETSDTLALRLAAGDVAALPVEVISPCVVLVDFRASSDGNGVGTGGLAVHLGLSGELSKPINIPTHTNGKPTATRGHTLRGVGPEILMFQGSTGSLEIERIRFVSVDSLVTPGVLDNTAAGRRAVRSRMAGAVVGPVRAASGLSFDAIFDDTCPIGGGQQGSNDTDDLDFSVRLPETGGRVAIAASLDRSAASLIDTGYVARRHGADLLVYEYTATSTAGPSTNYTGVFPATGVWEGCIQFRITGAGNVVIAVDGTDRHTFTPSKWRHFIPGAFAETSALTIMACAARHRVRG